MTKYQIITFAFLWTTTSKLEKYEFWVAIKGPQMTFSSFEYLQKYFVDIIVAVIIHFQLSL